MLQSVLHQYNSKSETLFNSDIDVTQMGYDGVADGISLSVLAAKQSKHEAAQRTFTNNLGK